MCYHKITLYVSVKFALYSLALLIKLHSFPQSLMFEYFKTYMEQMKWLAFYNLKTKKHSYLFSLERVKNLELKGAKPRALRHTESVLHPRLPAERAADVARREFWASGHEKGKVAEAARKKRKVMS